MTSEEARELVDRILATANQPQLNDLQATILDQTWIGGTSRSIADRLDYKVDYINQVAARLWKALSICLDETVSKKNIKAVLHRYQNQTISKVASVANHNLTDWGESIDISQFYGRETELETIAKWAAIDRCRTIGIFGLGGIGKTAFSIKLAYTLQTDFEIVLWRSLRQAPTLNGLLQDILPLLGGAAEISIDSLLKQLRERRCLLLLDNIESILECGERGGSYLPGYENYSDALERICDESHQSCLVIAGREKPGLLDLRTGSKLPVRSWQLQGLPFAAARQILSDKGSIATTGQSQTLIDRLGGNPLALKIVASNIHNLFNNDISAFLAQGTTVFGSLWQLLDQQFQRLSNLQQQIMYWLAIARIGLMPTQLQPKLLPIVALPQVLEALVVLRDRSAIETTEIGLTQQPVVMEYIIERLIGNIQQEIISGSLHLLRSHALIEAKAPDYIRETQIQIILQPLAQQLLQHFGRTEKLASHLRDILAGLRDFSAIDSATKGINYSAGNIINLLCHLGIDLEGWDFSGLTVRQAYLAEVLLRNTNFKTTYFTETVFAETFGSVVGIAYSPNGKLLATGGTSDEIKIWDAETYQEILCCPAHRHWIMAVAFSPDSQYLATASDDYRVKLWDTTTGHCIQTYIGHEDSVNAVAFSPSGDLLASGAQDSTIRLWQIGTSEVRVLVGHENRRVWSVAFSPNGKILASGGEDCTIRLWDVATGNCLAVWPAHEAWIRSVAFSPNGQLLASCSYDRTIKLWDMDSYDCWQIWPGHQDAIVAIAFNPNGLQLTSASSDRTVKLWDVATGKCLKTFFGHHAGLWTVAFHPQGHQIASGAEDHCAKIWNIQTGTCTKTLTGHTNAILSVAVSPNGTYLASAQEDRTVRIWHIPSGKIVRTLREHTNTVWSVAFSANGEFLVSGSADHTVKLWQWQTGKLLQSFQGHRSWVWIVAFSPDNQQVASGSYDQTIKIWNINGDCLQTLYGHTSSIASLVFSPNGQHLASGSYDNTFRIWNLATGECDRLVTDHENSVWSLKFSPNGEYLLSGSFDRTIKLWSVTTGECIRTYRDHPGFVKTLQFTPDGQHFVCGSFSGEITLWNVESGECLQTLEGHAELIYMLDVAMVPLTETEPPKLLAFSCSFDETIKAWDLQSSQCLGTWKPPRPYEGMSIGGIVGLNESQVASLQALGAI
jgi:WD40 repeat protein